MSASPYEHRKMASAAQADAATSAVLIQSVVEPEPVVHIASIVIHVRPHHLAGVKDWIVAYSDVQLQAEIHAESEQGKLVVVLETENEKYILNLIDRVQEQTGVLNAALVYHEIINEEG